MPTKEQVGDFLVKHYEKTPELDEAISDYFEDRAMRLTNIFGADGIIM